MDSSDLWMSQGRKTGSLIYLNEVGAIANTGHFWRKSSCISMCERSLNGQEVLALSVVKTDVSNC